MIAAAVLAAFVGGVCVGCLGLSIWWVRQLRNPETARRMIQQAWKSAQHPHWLQRAEDDPRRVCPCCGWREEATPSV